MGAGTQAGTPGVRECVRECGAVVAAVAVAAARAAPTLAWHVPDGVGGQLDPPLTPVGMCQAVDAGTRIRALATELAPGATATGTVAATPPVGGGAGEGGGSSGGSGGCSDRGISGGGTACLVFSSPYLRYAYGRV